MRRLLRGLVCSLMLAVAATALERQAFAQVQAQSGYQITIRTLTGVTYTVDVDGATTVAQVKQKIAVKNGIPVDQQTLIFAGLQLQDIRKLDDYSIGKDSTLHLLLR